MTTKSDPLRAERFSLGVRPTPLEPLDRLSAYLGGPRIWAKRDDYTGLGGGGNKVRKLEFLIADALRQQADIVLTCGAVQSNHARTTAAVCAKMGLPCELWLSRIPDRTVDYERSGNLLLDGLFGAEVNLLPVGSDAGSAALRRADELRNQGRRPYFIPSGGSTAVGARGYVAGAVELLTQVAELGVQVATVVTATGSCGTMAGLAVGLHQMEWSGRLLGVSVGSSEPDARARVTQLAAETAAALGLGSWLDFVIDDSFIGPGYGYPTPEGLDAIRLLARLEGLLLDPVYTGKAMAALIASIRTGALDVGADDVVFLHTGGSPALFGYLEEM